MSVSPYLRALAMVPWLLVSACVADIGDEDVDIDESGVTGAGSGVRYARGVVRLDLVDGRCSGFLVGPNLIVTAAHCVVGHTETGTYEGTYHDVRQGHIQVRVHYRPSEADILCVGEPCLTASGGVRRTRLLAWWSPAYPGHPDPDDDIAVLTGLTGEDFVLRGRRPGDAAPALSSADMLRILGVALPVPPAPRGGVDEWPGTMLGYGAAADDVATSVPRYGTVLVDRWSSTAIRAAYRGDSIPFAGDAICAGDSGGPLTFQGAGVFGRTYVGGIASQTSSRDGACPEQGDDMWWTRVSAQMWILNTILEWAERAPCSTFTTDELPDAGRYHRCW